MKNTSRAVVGGGRNKTFALEHPITVLQRKAVFLHRRRYQFIELYCHASANPLNEQKYTSPPKMDYQCVARR